MAAWQHHAPHRVAASTGHNIQACDSRNYVTSDGIVVLPEKFSSGG